MALVVIARLDRVIQYTAAARIRGHSGGILGRPVKPGDDNLCLMQASPLVGCELPDGLQGRKRWSSQSPISFRNQEIYMKTKYVLPALAAAVAIALAAAASVPPAFAASSGALKALDPDKDGTVDRFEANAAASKLFDQLDRDKDGTLDRRELRGRVTAKEFAATDPDKDGTLDKNEYLAVVAQRFKAADPDGDGTLDGKELKSSAGRSLLRLMVK
jgi:hypothetical protein